VLVLSWGSTYAAALAGVRRVRRAGRKVAQAHLVHLNPFPSNLGEVLKGYEHVLIPEGNLGQLSLLVRAKFLVDAKSLSKVEGRPFQVSEVQDAIFDLLGERSDSNGRGPEAGNK
jgi:2-oxoglutarate ferredoxin oxidoreductase subunit alpha